MKKHFNEDDVLRFVFDEMDPAESEAFATALCDDAALWTMYEEVQGMKKQLETISYEPSDASIDKIMDFVRHLPPATSDLEEPTTMRPLVVQAEQKTETAIVRPLANSFKVFGRQISYTTVAAAATLLLIFGATGILLNQSESINATLNGGQADHSNQAINASQAQEAKTAQWEDPNTEQKIDTMKQKLEKMRQHKDGF